MAAPIIDPTQENLACLQWRPAAFGPEASNTPTSWAVASGTLPIGVTINGTTGLCSGTPTTPGVYSFGLKAHNADGWSDEVSFCWPVRQTSASAGSDIDVVIDLIDLTPRLVRPVPIASVASVASAPAPSAAPAILHNAKLGSDVFYRVQFTQYGSLPLVTFTDLKATLKQYDSDAVICASDDDGTITSFFALDGGAYRVYLGLKGAPLTSALSNYEKDSGTVMLARLEFEWKAANPDHTSFGPVTQYGSSNPVLMQITRPQRILS